MNKGRLASSKFSIPTAQTSVRYGFDTVFLGRFSDNFNHKQGTL